MDDVEGCPEFRKSTVHGYSAQREDRDLKHIHENTKYSWPQQNCSFMKFSPDNKREIENSKYSWLQHYCSFMKSSPDDKREIGEPRWGDFENVFSPRPFRRFIETDWSLSPLRGEERPKNYSVASLYETSPAEHESGRPDSRNQVTMLNIKKSSIRSHSAPPFYKGKKRYLDLTDSSTMLSAKCNFQNTCVTLSSAEPSNSSHGELHAETMNLNCSQKSFGQYRPSPMEKPVMDCAKRSGLEITPEIIAVENGGPQPSKQFINMESVECLDLKEIQDSFDSGSKWRNCCLPTAGESGSAIKNNQDMILDISSDILHLDGVA